MKGKKAASVITAGVLLTLSMQALAGCSSNGLGGKMFDFGSDYYKTVDKRYTLNYDEMLYDDFKDGIDLDRWVISDSVWEQWDTDQNGVRPQNVFLVDDEANPDTHLLLRANGSYYRMEDDTFYTDEEKAAFNNGAGLFTAAQGYGKNSGACLSTIEALGPGRYDVKMKACPRIGALTSMWVYSWFTQNDGSTQQNEIDIELGLSPNFSVVSYTTWTAPSQNTNYLYPLQEENQDKFGFYVNDGDWHIYSFDWVTDADVPYVDYYIDGKLAMTLNTNVPTTNATLNLGIWCPSWCGGGVVDHTYGDISLGSRVYEYDYAEISWWRYIPFEMKNWEQRPVQNRNYADGYVPKTITSLPKMNKCINGDFERTETDYRKYPDNVYTYGQPWEDFTRKNADGTPTYAGSAAKIVKNGDNSYAQVDNRGDLGQWLFGAAYGFKYKLELDFRTTGGAEAEFLISNILGYSVNSADGISQSIPLGKSDDWKHVEIEFTVEDPDAQSIQYSLINSNGVGSSFYDNIKLTYVGHK